MSSGEVISLFVVFVLGYSVGALRAWAWKLLYYRAMRGWTRTLREWEQVAWDRYPTEFEKVLDEKRVEELN